jgi:hypothetical protein
MIEQRVRDLIGRAYRRQLWLLFLDEVDRQLPLLVPIDGLPSQPEDDGTDQVVGNIKQLMHEIGATALVIVWERDGPPTMTHPDTLWARSLASSCRARGVPLRAMLLSHRKGVRWIPPDDYVE